MEEKQRSYYSQTKGYCLKGYLLAFGKKIGLQDEWRKLNFGFREIKALRTFSWKVEDLELNIEESCLI